MRLQQGSNYPLGSYEVGVMHVLQDPDEPGRAVAHLSVYDRATSSDEHVVVRAGDELTVGAERYLVTRVVVEDSDARPWLELAPVGASLVAEDHAATMESLVHRFFAGPGTTRLVVDETTTEVPLVAANLSTSTRSFSAGQLLYVYDVYWGMNERAKVVGRYRRRNRFVTGVCRIDLLENARPKIAAHPGVLQALGGERINAGIFLRFLDLPGGFTTFADYRDSVLGGGDDPAPRD